MVDPLDEVVAADSPQGQGVMLLKQEVVTASDFLEEFDESATPPRADLTTIYTDEKMGALHRFLGQLMSAPEESFSCMAPDLARQLHAVMDAHIESLLHVRFERDGLDLISL